MTDIKSLSFEELTVRLTDLGEPKFRSKQVFSWLHRGVRSFDGMTDIPHSLKLKLREGFYITCPTVLSKQESGIDGTVKYLWGLGDGNSVESVLMGYRHGNTVCVSTQVGCRMGCAFCASAIGGLVRNLSAAEMLDQVLFTQIDSGKSVSNVVLMGIGEPLDNFDNVLKFIGLINHPEGINIGMRHISLSTSGIIDKIDKLAGYVLQLTLSVSLHAPDDETRNRLMPVNRGVGVDALIRSCDDYFRRTGRRITYEYAMIDGVNDSQAQARLLGEKLKGTPGAHVNLIPLNSVSETGLIPSGSGAVESFKKTVESYGITVTVRRRLGSDIEASCGQLRRKRQS